MKQGEVKKLIHRFGDELQKKKGNAIAVTSLLPGEGRTFLVAVLALGAAVFLKKKVLIVDASSQPHEGHLYLDRIFSDESVEKYVDLIKPKQAAGIDGEAADFELKTLLDHYRDEYDLVIFDTTAIQDSNQRSMDPLIVSKTAGNTVMIVSSKSVASGDFRRVRTELQDWNIPILGTVYNFWSSK
jgi:Mrp family chromosome partitioning ATPase